MFEEFIKRIAKRLEENLPGEKAQFKMSPKKQNPTKEYLEKNINPKRSAILILLYPDKGKINTVFILRTTYEGNHSGQVAFPGGKFEQKDLTLENTALREAEEEIGVCAKKIKMLGRLTELYIPISNYLLHPFVGAINAKPEFVLDANEVEKIIEIQLENLFDDSNMKEKKIVFQSMNKEIRAPYFDINGHTVWGATAMILSELKEAVKEIQE